MNPLVTVVIPTYRRPYEKVAHAIGSVKNQTYHNIEIIVVDDNDEAVYSEHLKVNVEKLKGVKYFKHSKNKGACAARNTGILESNGEYIAFLDDDDEWEETKIEKQLMKFENDDVALVYCGIKYKIEKSNQTFSKPAIGINKKPRDILVENYIGSTSCGIVRKSAAIDVGMFDVNLKSGQDLDFWYRLAKKYKINYVEECLLNYTLYSNGTITSNVENRLKSNLYLKNKYLDDIEKDNELFIVYDLKIIKSYIKSKNKLKAFNHFLNMVKAPQFSLKTCSKILANETKNKINKVVL